MANDELSQEPVLEAITAEIAEHRDRHWSVVYSALLAQGAIVAAVTATPRPLDLVVRALLCVVLLVIGGAGIWASAGFVRRIRYVRESRTALVASFEAGHMPEGRHIFPEPRGRFSPSRAFQIALMAAMIASIALVGSGGVAATPANLPICRPAPPTADGQR